MDIFISYARRDEESVHGIVGDLSRAGYSVWIDRSGILGGRWWKREIVSAIRESKAFVIVLSPHSVTSKNVWTELELCDRFEKYVVPLLLAETAIPDEMQFQLAGRQHIDWRGAEGFEKLCDTLKSLQIECRDTPLEATTASPKPASSWWRRALGVFGVLAVLAAAVAYKVAGPAPGKTGAVLGIAPVDVAIDKEQLGLWNDLRLKISAVFSKAGLNVFPQESFSEKTFIDWSFDSWDEGKKRDARLGLLLKTSLTVCPPSKNHFWVAQLYGRDLEPLHDLEQVRTAEAEVLVLRLAFELSTAAQDSIKLEEKHRQAVMREIVKRAYDLAGRLNMEVQAKTARSLLDPVRPIDEETVDGLLKDLNVDDHIVCDKAAEDNRKDQLAKGKAYS